MDIRKVELTNFISHKKTTFNVPKGLTGLVGLNGAGKSSLIKDSVTWGLWGKARCGGAGDDLIHKDEAQCTIKITFAVNGDEYVVTRDRVKDKKTSLSFTGIDKAGNVKELSRPVLKTTQEDINKVLGMDYDVFRNSCCIEQGYADSFSKLAPSDAGRLILSILQLNDYNKYKNSALEKYTDLKSEYEKTCAAREYLLGKQDELSNVEKRAKDVELKIEEYKAQYEEHEETRKNLEHEIVILQNQWNEVAIKINSFRTEHDSIDTELQKLLDKTNVLENVNGSCPLCRTSLNKDTKESVQKSLLKEYQDLLDKKDKLQSKLGTLHKEQGTDLSENMSAKMRQVAEHKKQAKQAYSEMLDLQGQLKILTGPSEEKSSLVKKLEENKKATDRLKKGTVSVF